MHAIAFAVNTIPDRSLSFQVVFTGCETEYDDWEEGNIHGGAMWARMPIQGLVADIPLEEWGEPMEDHIAQPWDCESRDHSVIVMDRVSSSPWLCKIDGKFYNGKYMFTVDTQITKSQIVLHNTNNHMYYILQKIVSGKVT